VFLGGFLQRVSVSCYAERCIAVVNQSVLSICLSATNRSGADKIDNFHSMQRHFSDVLRRVAVCNTFILLRKLLTAF